MLCPNKIFITIFLVLIINGTCMLSQALTLYTFTVKEATYERLCSSKKILTVNGQFPGPTLYAYQGDTIYVDVYNQGNYNITIHWHGVKQPHNPWSDGPEYITQCPIQPGGKFRQKVIFTEEEGTLWWHAHSDWSRATVHGPIIVYPKPGNAYPFPKPYGEVPIVLGEWWKEDIVKVLNDFLASGGQPVDSDAYTMNGQPGDLYPCSKNDTFLMNVTYGKTYLLRLVNAVMNEILFFSIANHTLTVVSTDGSYAKPFTSDIITITPGQTLDCLLHANQDPNNYYYIAAKPYSSAKNVDFDNTTTTAILRYEGLYSHYPISRSLHPILPYLPDFNDTAFAVNFSGSLRSLASSKHPIDVPQKVNTKLKTILSVNLFPCVDNTSTCDGPNGTRLAASMNNITWVKPSIDILEAYYYNIKKVYKKGFPKFPHHEFNYTAEFLPLELELSKRGTRVRYLKYTDTVELVLQGTNLVSGIDHPMHLHGFAFYVVGSGFGNFDSKKDPNNYNLIDPPKRNTIMVPINGWAAIRFKANNPGVWYMHCHFERHSSWGMNTVFIVKDGKSPGKGLLPPPPDMPPC